MVELEKKDAGVEWVDAKDDFIVKRDEKLILGLYRLVKVHWKFFVGFCLGALVMGLIFK